MMGIVKRSMNALNAIRIIRNFFTKQEPLGLVTSKFYLILYYYSEIWHLPTLKLYKREKCEPKRRKTVERGLPTFSSIHEDTQMLVDSWGKSKALNFLA